MVAVGIIVVLVVLLIGVTLFVVLQNRQYTQMSFRETLELTDLPIITFHHIKDGNDIKLNFLLDTGANRSIIDNSMISSCDYEPVGSENSLCGLDGVDRVVYNVDIVLNYSGKPYEEVFQVSDMKAVFDKIKEDKGVTIHGILGNTFFNRYRYVIDFDKYVVYSKTN